MAPYAAPLLPNSPEKVNAKVAEGIIKTNEASKKKAAAQAAAAQEPWKNDSRYERPATHRKGFREEVWDIAEEESPDGIVRDPTTGEQLDEDGPWDAGHLPGWEFRKQQESAWRRGLTRDEFLKEYDDPGIYEPEAPGPNRGHGREAPNDETEWPAGAHRPAPK